MVDIPTPKPTPRASAAGKMTALLLSMGWDGGKNTKIRSAEEEGLELNVAMAMAMAIPSSSGGDDMRGCVYI